jgi:hypothetical protein
MPVPTAARGLPCGNRATTAIVLRAMTTSRRASRPLLVATLLVTVGLAACSAAAPPAASPTPGAPASSPPTAVASPSLEPGGGGSSGNAGSGIGIDLPLAPTPVDPGAGQPTLVVPKPGQADIHPVAPTALQASVDGRHVLVKVTYYSGVEPCSVLDSVKVERSGTDIAITPFEGTGDGDVMCIEIAVLKATIVDLGDLEPGTYRILSPGSEAPPVEVTII